MISSALKRPLTVAGSFLALAVFGLGSVAYATSPYLKVYGGDVWAGGWYYASDGSCDTTAASNYQDPLFSQSPAYPTADSRSGGILTYAKTSAGNSQGGASGQYGVFALGTVDGNNAGNGFYSDGALANGATANTALTFANNDPANAWGGAFQFKLGSASQVRQAHCIPDYYGKLATATSPTALSSGFSGSPSTGDYTATGTSAAPFHVTAGSVTIARGTQVTLYVDGPAYVDQNITYDLDTADDVPKFALVVRGPLYIAPNVTRLDGVYIAQPKAGDGVDSDNGNIWTCHPADGTLTKLDGSYISQNCGNQLVINGALVAKQINFLRVNGDVTAATVNENSSSGNIAEIINYTPAMIVGGPYFNQQPSGSLKITHLVSLPPLF